MWLNGLPEESKTKTTDMFYRLTVSVPNHGNFFSLLYFQFLRVRVYRHEIRYLINVVLPSKPHVLPSESSI